MMRIARALSVLGLCSRRQAERLVLSGRVAVNGVPVTAMATLVDLTQDSVVVDEESLGSPAPAQYYAVYKPRGVVSTVRDRHAARTVIQLVPLSDRLYPVGRLDKDSEGLILLTNDGDFAHAVTHPRYGVEKEYLALVPRAPTEEELKQLVCGIALDGRLATVLKTSAETRGPKAWVRLVLREGRHHEVRRLLGALGLSVQQLIRTRIGPVRLAGLRPGGYRELRPREVRALRGSSRTLKGENGAVRMPPRVRGPTLQRGDLRRGAWGASPPKLRMGRAGGPP